MAQPLLEGGVDDGSAEIIAELREEVRQLTVELLVARKDNARAVAALRHQLEPWYKALQQLFGEMDKLGVDAVTPASSQWEAVKQRLAPRLREAIDILLVQKAMKRTQLAAALRMDYSNCNKNVIGVLLRQGLMVDNGRELSLKEL
jgi:hypothetical protein